MTILARLNSILASPRLYITYQRLVGGIAAREICIRDYVQPTPGMVVLDIGCGPGYAVKCFPAPIYYGFDISPQYTKWANQRFSEHGRFYCGEFDESALEWLPKFDVVLMMGLLHHIDDRSVLQLLRLVKRAIGPQGCLVTLDGCYAKGQSRTAKFVLDGDRGQFIRTEAGYVDLARSVFSHVESAIRHDLFLIPFTALVLRCLA
jgi:SAM-dependent methyltransferase